MAVNIKTERIQSFPCISINAMDDDKEKSYAMHQSLLKKDIKSEANSKFHKELKIDVDSKFHKELKVDVGTNNFQNLMEYREAPASPGASSVHSLDMGGMDNLGSPTTPSSPVPVPPQEMDDERLPNELLDEICEDIGMKEGMELDFVEFLMEQDMVDPQVYMTPEAIRNTLASVASAPPSSQAPVMSTPTPKTTSNETAPSWQGRTCGSPSTTYSLASSTNCTVATSSGSSSPVAKRFHMSNSGPSSPVRTNAPMSPHGGFFKAPQTPPTPRRPSSTSQSIASPSITSTQGPQHSPLPQRPFSPSTTQGCVPSSPSQKSLPPPSSQPAPPSQQNCHQMAPPKSIPSHMQRPVNSHNFQRLGRPAPPNVNVQNMQQKWVGPNQSQNGMMGNQSCAMGNPHQQYGRPLDSPLDHGYFSGDTASVRSYGSSVTSTVPSSISSSNSTIHNQNFNGRQNPPLHSPSMAPPQQKSVHFADIQGQPQANVQLQCQSSNDRMGYPPSYDTNIPDCDLENDFQRNVPSKIMPRLTPSMKSEIAPYTVPGNNGAMSPYGDYSRNNNSRPGSGENPMASLPPYQKSGDMYNVDCNKNSMHMNNFNNSMQSNEMQDPNYRSSCSGGAPIGMQPLRHYDGPECGMPPSTEQMYMDETDSFKQTVVNMGYCDGQYRSQNQNLNNSCSVMSMNQKMTMPAQGAPQGMMDQNQGGYPGGNYCANPMQSSCVSNVPRSMHMHAPQMMGGPQGNMTAGYDQTQYNNGGRMPPSANMNNSMYQNPQTPISASNMSCQNPGGSNQNWVGTTPQTPVGMHSKVPHPGMSGIPPQQGMQTPTQTGLPPGASPMPPCTQPNCQSCKTGSPHRPPMLASQQTFIQHLITDRSNAFRSHPLFPLLRDLIIADMNFSSPSFPYQLISNLPAEFDKLLQNFLHRNPPSGNYQGNYAVESVIMDALKYAHHCLIEKIRSRQEQDKHSKSTSKSLSAIEEFCEKFDQSVRQTIIKPATFQIPNQNGGVTSSSMVAQSMGGSMTPTMGTPSKDHKFSEMDAMMIPSLFGSPMAKKGLDMSVICSPHYKSLKDLADCSDGASMVSSSSNHSNKSESKKHPSLPKEAVAIMLEWLRQHKDNPYPNDDEKAMLIKQTGLTINQINYWFTNARRRILPKWAQQCK